MADELFGKTLDEDSELYLEHYGKKYRSGRWPYGSGEDPYQHDPKGFYTRYKSLKADGYSEQQLCKEFKLTSGQLRAKVSAVKEAEMLERNALIMQYKAHGESNTAIAEKMGINESVVRAAIKQNQEGKVGRAKATADILKNAVNEKGVIDIGAGVNLELGISETKLNTAIQMLEDEGYAVHNIKVEQATNKGKFTTVRVLAPPDTKWEDVYYNLDSIHQLEAYSPDGGDTYQPLVSPKSISSDRVLIRYLEDGGADRDGTIELRPGVDDISLGNSSYAQIRMGVDDKYYAKGMAFYNDNIPDGYDVVINSNKPKDGGIAKALKPMKDDPENPFGALIKANGQTWYTDENGEQKLSVCNKLKEESDWEDYSKNLASQFLAKQDPELITKQLDLTLGNRRSELDDILQCENPAIKQSLLYSLADDLESSAVHLKAAPLPGQSTKVLLPINSLKDNECYCPALPDGQEVCLVRYPHAGPFEIPRLVVNNSNKEGKNLIGNKAIDVIGINKASASILSGADFDGDVAIVIPVNDKVKIKTSKLEALKDFDPQEAYPYKEGQKKGWEKGSDMEQNQMGQISNLITDMYAQGATDDELARATKHSMVIIDTGKHKLNYYQSELDNDIQSLKDKYQNPNGKVHGGGASTLLSKASGDIRVPEIKYYKVNKETGEKEAVYSNREYTDYKKVKKEGKPAEGVNYIHTTDENGENVILKAEKKKATTTISKMENVKDAYELSSGSKVESYYADFANALKSLAIQARKEAASITPVKPDDKIKKLYSEEISSLESKLLQAQKNAPRERAAQIKAASEVQKYKKDHKGIDYNKDDKAKLANRTLQSAREQYGAKMSGEKGRSIKLTQKEWDAINNNAISSAKVKDILRYTPDEEVKKFAMPKAQNYISEGKKSMMKSMSSRGYTLAEIAEALNVSTTTVSNYT